MQHPKEEILKKAQEVLSIGKNKNNKGPKLDQKYNPKNTKAKPAQNKDVKPHVKKKVKKTRVKKTAKPNPVSDKDIKAFKTGNINTEKSNIVPSMSRVTIYEAKKSTIKKINALQHAETSYYGSSKYSDDMGSMFNTLTSPRVAAYQAAKNRAGVLPEESDQAASQALNIITGKLEANGPGDISPAALLFEDVRSVTLNAPIPKFEHGLGVPEQLGAIRHVNGPDIITSTDYSYRTSKCEPNMYNLHTKLAPIITKRVAHAANLLWGTTSAEKTNILKSPGGVKAWYEGIMAEGDIQVPQYASTGKNYDLTDTEFKPTVYMYQFEGVDKTVSQGMRAMNTEHDISANLFYDDFGQEVFIREGDEKPIEYLFKLICAWANVYDTLENPDTKKSITPGFIAGMWYKECADALLINMLQENVDAVETMVDEILIANNNLESVEPIELLGVICPVVDVEYNINKKLAFEQNGGRGFIASPVLIEHFKGIWNARVKTYSSAKEMYLEGKIQSKWTETDAIEILMATPVNVTKGGPSQPYTIKGAKTDDISLKYVDITIDMESSLSKLISFTAEKYLGAENDDADAKFSDVIMDKFISNFPMRDKLIDFSKGKTWFSKKPTTMDLDTLKITVNYKDSKATKNGLLALTGIISHYRSPLAYLMIRCLDEFLLANHGTTKQFLALRGATMQEQFKVATDFNLYTTFKANNAVNNSLFDVIERWEHQQINISGKVEFAYPNIKTILVEKDKKVFMSFDVTENISKKEILRKLEENGFTRMSAMPVSGDDRIFTSPSQLHDGWGYPSTTTHVAQGTQKYTNWSTTMDNFDLYYKVIFNQLSGNSFENLGIKVTWGKAWDKLIKEMRTKTKATRCQIITDYSQFTQITGIAGSQGTNSNNYCRAIDKNYRDTLGIPYTLSYMDNTKSKFNQGMADHKILVRVDHVLPELNAIREQDRYDFSIKFRNRQMTKKIN